MRIHRRVFVAMALVVALATAAIPFRSSPVLGADDVRAQLEANLTAYQPLADATASAPEVQKPDWYYKTTVYFTVAANGVSTSALSQFASMIDSTLNDSRGWSQLGARFVQSSTPSSGTMNFVLAAASLLPSYSSGCSADWSCTVGDTVIINYDRWLYATDAWNSAGGNLPDYQHMVINHEAGHWLGHGHLHCSGAGQPAPIMQQQSIDLEGCKFNPWPLASELWTTRF